MTLAPLGFTAREILEAGVLSEGESEWHANPCKDGVWRWHASSVSQCPRALILGRAGYSPDKTPLEGQLTMEVGTAMHAKMEQWIDAYCAINPAVKVLVKEVGYWHKTLPLAAKPDVLLEVDGVGAVLVDHKTIHEDGIKRMTAEARAAGRYTNAKPEHMLQLAATAMVLESNGYPHIGRGVVNYISKNSFWAEMCDVDLDDQSLRDEVTQKLAAVEAAWAAYGTQGVAALPPRLPFDSWQCRAVKGGTAGRWCRSRSICQDRRLP